MLLRLLAGLLVLAATAAAGWWFLLRPSSGGPGPQSRAGPPASAGPVLSTTVVRPGRPPSQDCSGPLAYAVPAALNATSLRQVEWAPFRHPERGWEVYAPQVAREVATVCPPDSAGFASALAGWERRKGRPADGVLSTADFEVMKNAWYARRPFVAASRGGGCPPARDPATLVSGEPGEGYGGEILQLKPEALSALRRMVAAARAEVPEIAADPQALQVFSSYRGPDEAAARCADGGCGTATRARCSAHQTGLAVDLVVGAAPGHRVDSSDDANRLHMSRTATYRWLVANASRFGFENYVFEPWHWEYVGPVAGP
ncbi:MAG TPA: D-alanyl-D-alanine carboxypeptidase family protein [Caulobacteraceae bacterium]|nr:D-alanyl-D-alanine carboxypeptidase family protein [Caulobacteraceae bacterium]